MPGLAKEQRKRSPGDGRQGFGGKGGENRRRFMVFMMSNGYNWAGCGGDLERASESRRVRCKAGDDGIDFVGDRLHLMYRQPTLSEKVSTVLTDAAQGEEPVEEVE